MRIHHILWMWLWPNLLPILWLISFTLMINSHQLSKSETILKLLWWKLFSFLSKLIFINFLITRMFFRMPKVFWVFIHLAYVVKNWQNYHFCFSWPCRHSYVWINGSHFLTFKWLVVWCVQFFTQRISTLWHTMVLSLYYYY